MAKFVYETRISRPLIVLIAMTFGKRIFHLDSFNNANQNCNCCVCSMIIDCVFFCIRAHRQRPNYVSVTSRMWWIVKRFVIIHSCYLLLTPEYIHLKHVDSIRNGLCVRFQRISCASNWIMAGRAFSMSTYKYNIADHIEWHANKIGLIFRCTLGGIWTAFSHVFGGLGAFALYMMHIAVYEWSKNLSNARLKSHKHCSPLNHNS